jgi:hypothetical protein
MTVRENLTDEPDTLVTNCADLWEAGELKLKPLAMHFRSMVANLTAAESRSAALRRDELFGGPYGPARGAWEYLADTTVRILRETAENLEATGDVLVMASQEYQAAEDINTEALKRAKGDAIFAEQTVPEPSRTPGGGSS